MEEESINKSEIIKEIQDGIRFIILVAIFFSGVLSNFFGTYDKNESGKVTLSYAGLVALYLIVYLLFEVLKNKINIRFLKWTYNLTLAGAGLFLIPIIFMSSADKIYSNWPLLALYKLSLWGIMLIPVALIAIISWSSEFKKNISKNSKN